LVILKEGQGVAAEKEFEYKLIEDKVSYQFGYAIGYHDFLKLLLS
jgi:hypothetical protein